MVAPLGYYARGFDPLKEYEFMRANWTAPMRFRMYDMPPVYNINGLYFREIV